MKVLFTDISKASGSRGGTTYYQTKGGTVARKRSQPVQPNTGPQQNTKIAFADGSDNWKRLPISSRNAWKDWAGSLTRTNTIGVEYTPNGRNLQIGFVQLNTYITSQLGTPAVDSDIFPTIPGEMAAPVFVTKVPETEDDPGFIVNASSIFSADNQRIIVEIGPQVSAERESYSGPYNAATLQADSLPPASDKDFEFLGLIDGGRYPWRARSCNVRQESGNGGKLTPIVTGFAVASIETTP